MVFQWVVLVIQNILIMPSKIFGFWFRDCLGVAAEPWLHDSIHEIDVSVRTLIVHL